jgi:hypothetical protein
VLVISGIQTPEVNGIDVEWLGEVPVLVLPNCTLVHAARLLD